MAVIKKVKGVDPQIDSTCWLADNATVIGDVKMGKDCSVWYNAVVRGDVCSIEMGDNCNIQDGAVIHGTLNMSKTVLGDNVSIGHNAIVHGAIVEDNVLIGMGAIVLDNVTIKSGSLIAAGSVVLANTVLEENSLYAGTPAKRIKTIDEKLKQVIDKTPEHYKMYTTWISD
ncbi:gamma carbonic anhydrase family protein [Roseivirga misakiensis]|uniref:Gamma carbonic anhydrase family protein n=1 Tax=Roseivirga misakiensis TaxID=1563681 RepID=A0A1E5SYX7_9BACT|nr:gamma carbonic anhydrase family protein [Roseivirga misakiensis]OEK04321.1 gamma carbonic anhydrase family protein [Roseivirga misakiensis]